MQRAVILRFAFAVAFLFSAALAAAQESYPAHPITLVVPFPPGGVADIVGRPFADALSRELKTPVVIENKPG
ncbi:MAG TPA: tripartite tricarboxylate transporter substrate binding protein, partial [Casimicrobiaceae bacterium]|nr:tripartite tricarboxylate transporter substrate binding protein [Casimicrobiaceae bacterium]